MKTLKYTGQSLLHSEVQIPETEDRPAEIIYPYLPKPDLVKAVNMAILLGRPLLLMGEPGGGKSKLAQALAYELFHGREIVNEAGVPVPQDYRDWFFTWHIKSSSKAKEGLYEFDALKRLQDAQIPGADLNPGQYVRYGPMGEAFIKSTSEEFRPVLLIDEIDKADIDFPNDLLNELDLGSFKVHETKTSVKARVKPIVIITSNQERELPDAFLRRCIYHYIKPLEEADLRKIVISRFYAKRSQAEVTTEQEVSLNDKSEEDFLTNALHLFLRIRSEIKNNAIGGKNVSTSELLDWYEVLKEYAGLIGDKGKEEVADFLQPMYEEIKRFRSGQGGIPLKQALFKNWETIVDFEKREKEYLHEQAR